MTAEPKRTDALQLIFSIFIGVLLVVVVGVGVWTFYPPPDSENSPKQQQLQKLYREQEKYNLKESPSGGSVPVTDSIEAQQLQDRINTLQDQIDRVRKHWAVVTSIIVLSIATLLMAISLFLPEVAKVFSNGILLGGLFTVLYGTGVSFTGGDSRARFYVVLAALVLSLATGYLRFIRGHRAAPAAAVHVPAEGAAIAEADAAAFATLDARVSELERRASAAAEALSPPQEAERP